ncbi:hypothetical protein SCP_0107220 [Sparassis crispa]|uniref:F-box domain-containing protein n=1 Tax=Sparassis crispa TaxID=139825 RepID=A0A401G6P8_9APHY|nr:hypothetical protein SCP_0107220 [Sparassis crispa]GBE77840.1 hypothetical protein SCP_0107220 [Sparassis crispa]
MHPSTSPWGTLPPEMKLSVADLLDPRDMKALAMVDRESYDLCVPSIFRSVKIQSYEALQTYLSTVPSSYSHYIRRLHVCTKLDQSVPHAPVIGRRIVTDTVIDLLAHCSQLEQLTLCLEGSLSKNIIPLFGDLRSLTNLSIHHCGDENRTLLSERFVVSVAAAVPNLRQLSLDRITRSALHAPELIGVYPFIPLVAGDEDIPDHALLGSELRLPSLLRLSGLKKLRIRDTHLGDPQWGSTPVCCSLEVLDLGSCYHESLDFNRICTERIMGNIGHTVDEFALNTALTSQTFEFAKHNEPPLKRLRKVHLTPLFPVENVVDTLTTLSDSPIEQVLVQCHEDDVVDMCSALEDFLSLRVQLGKRGFYQHLTEISVKTVRDITDALTDPFADDAADGSSGIVVGEHTDAVRHLREFLHDLRLTDGNDLSEALRHSLAPASDCSTTSALPLAEGKV